MSEIFNAQEAFDRYFGTTHENDNPVPQMQPAHPEKDIYATEQAANRHFTEVSPGRDYTVAKLRSRADEYISDIEIVADIIKRLCNAAWGEGWGECSPDLKRGEDSAEIILPQIVLDMNTRDIADISGLKPRLMDIIPEEDEEGNETGDAFLVYRQWFDCNIEFDIYGKTNFEARRLQMRLEDLIAVYSGYLKRHGISEIYFEREVSPKFSLNYDEHVPMRCIFYYIRLERITPVRHSLIDNVNLELGAGRLSTEKMRMAFSTNRQNIDPVELAFFEGDTGITLT